MAQQATYLMVITMGQTLVLLSRNYDLSVGSTVALTSVVTAWTMVKVGGGGFAPIDYWLKLPAPVWLTLGLLVLFYILLNWTRLGRNAYAIGGNENAARLSGIPVGRNVVYLFSLCALLAGLAGIMLTARTSTGEATIGTQYPLQSIAAAALGGVSLFGGEGRMSGAVIGVVFIVVLSNGMNLVNISSYIQLIVLGAVLIVALIGNRLQRRLAV
jgi:ribose transport system permease protein